MVQLLGSDSALKPRAREEKVLDRIEHEVGKCGGRKRNEKEQGKRKGMDINSVEQKASRRSKSGRRMHLVASSCLKFSVELN